MNLIDTPLPLVTVVVFLFAYGNLGCAGAVSTEPAILVFCYRHV